MERFFKPDRTGSAIIHGGETGFKPIVAGPEFAGGGTSVEKEESDQNKSPKFKKVAEVGVDDARPEDMQAFLEMILQTGRAASGVVRKKKKDSG